MRNGESTRVEWIEVVRLTMSSDLELLDVALLPSFRWNLITILETSCICIFLVTSYPLVDGFAILVDNYSNFINICFLLMILFYCYHDCFIASQIFDAALQWNLIMTNITSNLQNVSNRYSSISWNWQTLYDPLKTF